MDTNGKRCPLDCLCLCHDTGGGVHNHYGIHCSQRDRALDNDWCLISLFDEKPGFVNHSAAIIYYVSLIIERKRD